MKAEVKILRGWRRITGINLIEEGDRFFSSWDMKWELVNEEWIGKMAKSETVIRKIQPTPTRRNKKP